MEDIDRQEPKGDAMAARRPDTETDSGGMVPPRTPQSASEPDSECQAPVATSAKDHSSRSRSFWRRWTTIGVVVAVVLVGGIVAGAVLATRSHGPNASGGNGDGNGAGGQTPLSGPQVNLTYSTYVGTALPCGVNQFLGMRYAAPPLGELRWRAPGEVPFNGTVQSATQYGPTCLGTNGGYGTGGAAEDCLFVDVWAPSNATSSSKLPVWVFIQGGGYVSNSNANWNGSEVVAKSNGSIVFVEFNYRVGLFGFLASTSLQKDGDLNVGLLDQRALLRWIQQYIGQFGGDPDHVVIHGASAGAGSVALHMMAYGGRDDHLFVGGVAESIFFPAQPYLHELEWQFDKITQDVGCNGTHDVMGCLRGKDIEILQDANGVQPFPNRTAPPFPLFYWTPCIDGDFLEDLPYKLMESGKFIDVPIIFGDDTDEGSSFVMDAQTQEDFSDFMQDNYPLLSDSDIAQVLAEYPKLPALAGHGTWFPTLSQAYGEATFTCPAINLLTILTGQNNRSSVSSNGPKAWSYRYDVQDFDQIAQGLGVQHLSEAPAIFGPNNTQGALASYYTYNAPVVPVMMDYWISFIMSLDPNTHRNAAAPRWEPWVSTSGVNAGAGAGGSRIVVRTGNLTMENVPPDQMARCQFWKGLAQTMEQKKK